MALKFGTSGVRGLAVELTDLEVTKFVQSFLKHAVAVMNSTDGEQRLFLADDYRESSPRITKAVIYAAQKCGWKVDYVGHLPTPALALCGIKNKSCAIMVTGSHIPADRNGLKFYLPGGEILKADEESIINIYEANDVVMEDFTEAGMLRAGLEGPLSQVYENENPEGFSQYVHRYTDFFGVESLAGQKVILYEHSAVGRKVIGEILENLGATVVRKGFSDQFIPVDTEALTDLERLKEWILAEGADALVSTDGDSDRPFVLDEKGDVLRGDELGPLVASALGIQAIALPVSCNSAVSEMNQFKEIEWTKIGSPFVISGMEEIAARGFQGAIAGYEANGGFLLGTKLEQTGKILESLPTRDAVLPIVVALKSCKDRGLTLSQLRNTLPQRATHSASIKGIPTEISEKLSNQIFSNPETFCDEFMGFVGSKLAKLDTTDGSKLIFKNSEVVFFRPSGNAPELRCYTEAVEPTRAKDLSERAMIFLNEYLNS
ncbi:MAG: phosphomannomutase [Pseudobdellovibrionaceae bacterium]|nr:MAG: phosphomannomutase [Pseudobdellovibrionaceae bacterium]